jgi:peptidoglycan/LPS O-acetylase OafA/YrhL
MLLSGALLALFMTGFWLYCLADAILTPAPECRGLTKPTWVVVIVVTFIVGALAWLMVRQPARGSSTPLTPWSPDDVDGEDYSGSQRWTEADDAVARHPAGRERITGTHAAPKGPDDDQEFLRALDRAIRGNRQPGGEA